MGRMANKKREDVREQDTTGLKYFDKLLPLFERLHEVGCEGDKAGNRQLHFDQYCTLILLFLFNPIVTSLRALQQASELAEQLKPIQKVGRGHIEHVLTAVDGSVVKTLSTIAHIAKLKAQAA